MVLGTSQTENAPHRIKAALKDLVVDEPKWMQRGVVSHRIRVWEEDTDQIQIAIQQSTVSYLWMLFQQRCDNVHRQL